MRAWDEWLMEKELSSNVKPKVIGIVFRLTQDGSTKRT